ncbi:sterol desaturase family protein [Pararhodonellum marinum]|uniref:sterol desaturase family protein n=1 Tax=Pararhodonellum marinum TaxID=2755358 RepID=UPI00188FA13D|nr:sterol desaturase family protein [Pararhodonellum marinum]
MKNHMISSRKKDGFAQFLTCLLVAIPLIVSILALADFTASSIGKYVLWFFSGWLSWTLVEYMGHRFWMHHRIYKMNNKIYASHMNHHKHPTDIQITDRHRIGLVSISFTLIYLSFIFNGYFTVFVGFYNGFVLYTLMHIVLHQKWAEKVFPDLQDMHIHHHGKYPDRCFSFSTTLWDRIFGTMAPKNAGISPDFRAYYFKKEPIGK